MDNNEPMNQVNTTAEDNMQQAPMPKEPKPKKKGLVWVIVAAVLVIAGVIACVVLLNRPKTPIPGPEQPEVDKPEEKIDDTFNFHVEENSIPGGSHDVWIDFSQKTLKVKSTRYCSAEDCDSISSEYETVITDEEITKIKKVISKVDFSEETKDAKVKDYFAGALSEIARDDGVMATREESGEYYDSLYGDDDLNKDGIVTYREAGTNYLDAIIAELYIK